MESIEEYPQCIISTSRDGKFQVNETALEELKSIDSPVVVIAITGKYRTGKSYLMNRIAGIQKGFTTGSTVESVTKGIWIWVRKHPEKDGVKLVLLDTEGLGDAKKGIADHDNWVFILVTLLSSILIHNILGAVDKETIANLSCVTELSRRLKTDEFGSNEAPAPLFIIAARDFTLSLKIQGKKVTPDEYLENLLDTKESDHPYNQSAGESIKKFFPRRKCFIFDRPATRDQLETLDELDDDDLSKTFLEDTKEFLDFIYELSDPRNVYCDGLTLNAALLGALIETYVSHINNGSVPSVESTVMTVIKRENRELVSKCTELYVTKLTGRLDLPVENMTELDEVHKVFHRECKWLFLKKSFGHENIKKEYLRALESAIDEKLQAFKEQNVKVSREKCEIWLKKAQSILMEKIAEGQYAVHKGYRTYLEDLSKFQMKYNRCRHLGTMREEVWKEYELTLLGYATKIQWTEITNAFTPWRENRENTIITLQDIVKAIEEQEKIHSIGQITYSSVGVASAGLTIGGLIAAPFTFGASLGLSIAGIATGAASGVAGITHVAVKEGIVKSNSSRARELLEEDNRLYELLRMKLEELDELTTGLSHTITDEGMTMDGALVIGKTAGAVGRAAFGIVDIAADFARIGGKIMGPVAGVLAVVDAVAIGYNAKKLVEGELSETSKQLNEYIAKLEDGLQSTCEWFESNAPPEEAPISMFSTHTSLPDSHIFI